MLADYNPVFSKMLYGDFIESGKEKIPLPDKKADDILEMLRVIFPTDGYWKAINTENVSILCKLADEYAIVCLEISCAHFLEKDRHRESDVEQIFIDSVKRRSKKIVRACVPIIANLPTEEIYPVLNEVPLEVRCAVLYQKIDSPYDQLSNLARAELKKFGS